MKDLSEKIAGSRIWSLLLFSGVGLILNLPGTAALPLMDRDEPKFSQATREMIETEQFTIPYFNKGYRFDKPPLTYWWMRIHYHLFGVNEFSARLHSVLASILTGYTIYLMGRFLFSNIAGLLAGLGWLSCFQVLIHSRLAVADMPMLLGVTITMYACCRLLFSEGKSPLFRGNFWLLVAGLTIGFLAKGPVAWIVPLLALALWRWPIGRRAFSWKWIEPVLAVVVAALLVSVWGIKALVETDGAYWKVGVGEHVVKRGVSAFNGRVSIPVVFYLATGLVSLLPWSMFLPQVWMSRAALKVDPKRALLLAWFIVPFIVFGLYSTQLPHYILPGFPGLMLLLFSGEKVGQLSTKFRKIWFWSLIALMGLISLVAVGAGLASIFPEPMAEVNRLIAIAGALIGLVGVGFPLVILGVSRQLNRWPLLVGVAVVAVGLTHLLTTAIRDVHPVVILEQSGVFSSEKGGKYVAQGFAEPSWVFYHWSGEPWILNNSFDYALKAMKENDIKEGIFLAEEWRIGEKAVIANFKDEPVPYLRDQRALVAREFDNENFEVEKISGINIARTSWVNLWFVKSKN